MTTARVGRPGAIARIAVLGSANMDLVGTAASLPRPGETVLGHGFAMVAGGKGANQAVAASRAGGRCVAVAAVGDDAFGPALRAGLAGADVDTSLLRVVPGPSGVALIAVDAAGENQILVAPGANARLTGLTAPERAAIAGADALICQLEVPVETVTEAAGVARAAGVRVVVNAAPARRLPDELSRATDLLVVNRGEAEVVTGLAGAGTDRLVDALLELAPRAVMTLGAGGAVYGGRDGLRLAVPAPVVSTVDTTAAGDAFIGALSVAWIEGRPIDVALRWACAAGAVCARTLGAADSLPVRAEIDELFGTAYPDTTRGGHAPGAVT
jgi:ribokinase